MLDLLNDIYFDFRRITSLAVHRSGCCKFSLKVAEILLNYIPNGSFIFPNETPTHFKSPTKLFAQGKRFWFVACVINDSKFTRMQCYQKTSSCYLTETLIRLQNMSQQATLEGSFSRVASHSFYYDFHRSRKTDIYCFQKFVPSLYRSVYLHIQVIEREEFPTFLLQFLLKYETFLPPFTTANEK